VAELGNTWQYAILEVYEPADGWPADGDPADWIDERKVVFCQGRLDHLIASTPLGLLLRWKVEGWLARLWGWLI